MSTNTKTLQAFQAYIHSTAHGVAKPHLAVAGDRRSSRPRRTALVVEFRDEVYAGLKVVMEEAGIIVKRAIDGLAIASTLNCTVPDLILINEDSPYGSGWLITYKVRLARYNGPVWLYGPRPPRYQISRNFCGVDVIIEYGGVLSRLLSDVEKRTRQQLDEAEDLSATMDTDCVESRNVPRSAKPSF